MCVEIFAEGTRERVDVVCSEHWLKSVVARIGAVTP
jgi:hypothetical protein